MPLRARWNGKDVLACLLSDEDWAAVERDRRRSALALVLPCCGIAAYQRTGSLGTRHFVHQPGYACATAPESEAHLLAKAEIARACHAQGWEPVTEYAGPDWTADVLATRARQRVVFEVQLSPQTARETRLRHARYQRDGVRDCWLFAKVPEGLEADENLPCFGLNAAVLGQEAGVRVGSASAPLKQFVAAWLSRRLRFSRRLVARTQQEVTLWFVPVRCSSCKAETHVYHLASPYLSQCGLEMSCGARPGWSAEARVLPLLFRPEILRLAEEACRSSRGPRLTTGEIRPRAVPGLRRSVMTFGCSGCGGPLVWEDYLPRVREIAASGTGMSWKLATRVALARNLQETGPHWCFRSSGSTCAEAAGN
jgi:hypothetical protein